MASQTQRELAETREARRERKAKEQQFKKRLLLTLSLIIVVLALLIVFVLAALLRARIGADAYSSAGDDSSVSLSMEYVGEKTTTAERETVVEKEEEPEKEIPIIVTDSLVSTNAYMFRPEDDKLVFEKGGSERIYPASMTKMMTGLLAIENLDLNLSHQITWEEVNAAWQQDATMAGFSDGETLPIEDILYGAMLPSGAEACYALASEVIEQETGETQWNYEELFAEKMNQKAEEIGMTNTHFVNCTGLQDENHYTTCEDMAKLLAYGLQNETFRKVVSAHSYTSSPTPYHENGVTLTSTMFAATGSSVLSNETSIMGGKTGFTDEAGHCLASYAKAADKDETEYILVTAGAYTEVNDYANISDAKYIYGQLPAE